MEDDEALGVDAETLALIAGPQRTPAQRLLPLPILKAPSAIPPVPVPQAPVSTPSPKKDTRAAPTTEIALTPKRQRTIEESLPGAVREPGVLHGDVTTRELSQKLSPVKKDPPLAFAARLAQLPTDDDFQNEGAWLCMCSERGLAPYGEGGGGAGPLSCNVQFIQNGGVALRQKVPELAVHIKALAQQGLDAAVTVQDPSGEMEGTVHAEVLSKHKGQVVAGAVLLLKEVPLYIPTGHEVFLIITLANLVAIYPPWSTAPALHALHTLPLPQDVHVLFSWRDQYLRPEQMSVLHQDRLQRGLLVASPKAKMSLAKPSPDKSALVASSPFMPVPMASPRTANVPKAKAPKTKTPSTVSASAPLAVRLPPKMPSPATAVTRVVALAPATAKSVAAEAPSNAVLMSDADMDAYLATLPDDQLL